MAFAAILIVASFAFSALADPGWSNGRRYDERSRRDLPQYRDDHRDHRDYRRPYYHPVAVYRRPSEPVVHVYGPHPAGFAIFFPHMSIQIR